MTEATPPLPLSRPLSVRSLPEEGVEKIVEATGPECEAVARACGLIAVKSLVAQFEIKARGTSVRVFGTMTSLVTQTCSVSLDPFDDTIEEDIDLTFVPQAGLEAWLAAHRPHPGEDLGFDDDPPDSIVEGKINLGAIATEFLALGLPPYPRKPGVAFDATPDAAEKEPSPFAALAQWKKGE